jgi:predicted RND superfamily exporter protein
MFLNVMTPLIMVISFADSMQLTFGFRSRLLNDGVSRYEAMRRSILVIGPACVLTHGTAGLSFVALLFSDSDLIRTFGEAGLIACTIALVAVLTLVPLLGILLVQRKNAWVLLVLLAAVCIELHDVIARLLGTHGAWLQLSPYAPVNWGLAVVATLGLATGALFLIPTTRPLVAGLFGEEETAFVAKVKGADFAVDLLTRFCAWIAARMVRHAGLYSLLAVLVVAGLGVIYANLEPRYRLADQVPDKQQAVQASSRLDAKLTGANPIDVLIEFPKGKSLYDPETLATIAAVHSALEKQAGVGNVWSLDTLRRWLAEKAGKSDVATLKQYVDILPEHLVRRFISEHQDAVVVSGRIPDKDASQLLPVVDQLDGTLGAVRAQHPGYAISVTGLAAIAARNSALMIGKLNRGLTIEFIFVAVFIGICFRSFAVMLMCAMPGIFPVLLSGTLLWLLGQGLQFASIVALTVSFGLGLSATIHFLNRQRLEDRPEDDPAVAVERATVLVGPALILTSVVLACGLAVTVFSDLPSLRLFGWLSAFAMLAALTADMLILRPTAMFLRRLSRRLRGLP